MTLETRYVITKHGIYRKEGKFIMRNGRRMFRATDGQEHSMRSIRETLAPEQERQYQAQEARARKHRIAVNRIIHPEDAAILDREEGQQ